MSLMEKEMYEFGPFSIGSKGTCHFAGGRSVQIFDLLEKAVNHGCMMRGDVTRQEVFQSDTLHSCP